MDSDQLKEFLLTQGVSCIVDASHPYAENISRYAIQACRELSLGYCRFERPALRQAGDFIICPDFQAAGELADGLRGNIFMTIGINHMAQVLAGIRERDRVRVRVLPQSETIHQLEDLGLNADHIIAMKGPFSEEMNYLLFSEAAASILISKDSGTQGGTDHKIEAARRLGMKIILVSRPALEYPNQFSDVPGLLEHLRRVGCLNQKPDGK
jgi:precorrin-6A/cobalt-precorrin-6A reductase